jgi:hypothetical protein
MDSLASWMDSNQVKSQTKQAKMEANIKTNWEKMKVHQDRMEALMDRCHLPRGDTGLSRKDRGHDKGWPRKDESRN